MASEDESPSHSLEKQISLNAKPINLNISASQSIDSIYSKHSNCKTRKSQKCDRSDSISTQSSQLFNLSNRNRTQSAPGPAYGLHHFSSKQLYDHITNLLKQHFCEIEAISEDHIYDSLKSVSSLLCDSVLMSVMNEQTLNNMASDRSLPAVVSSPHFLQVPAKAHSEKGKWCTHSRRAMWNEYIPSSALRDHPSFSIPPNKYFGLLRGSVRQDWNTIESNDDEERNWEELKPHWLELFFDLMFVAAIVHISAEVADAYENNKIMFIYSVYPQFGLLVLCWLEQVLYHSRFRMTQTADGLLRFVYMAFVLWMGLSIGDTNTQITQKLFLISYCFTKLIMSIMFAKTYFIPRARNHSIYMLIENIVSIIAVILIEIFVNISDDEYDDKFWIWMVIYWALFVYSWFHMVVLVYARSIRVLGINIPINVPHIAERMGAFVLILLGETIISIMAQHVESSQEDELIRAYAVTMSFFVIVYCIGKLYFQCQPTEHELHHHKKSHAMSTSIWRARIYKWFHILLFFGLLGLGLGSKLTVYQLSEYESDDAALVFMPGISCIVICVCINVIRLSHPFNYDKEHRYLVAGVWILRSFCLVIMFGILFAWKNVNHFVILMVYVLCFIVQIIVDFEARTRLIVVKKIEKKQSRQFHSSNNKSNNGNGKSLIAVDSIFEKRRHTINGDACNKEEDDEKHNHTRTVSLSFIGAF